MSVLALGLIAVWPQLSETFRDWKLTRAASKGPRRFAGRFVGMAYTPVSKKRGAQPEWSAVQTAASEILLESATPHLRGKAALLKGQISDAVESLRAAAATGGAEARSDLAAALVAEAEELDAYDPALDAVVEARRAIAQKPALAPAHFNLALALLRLGLTGDARAEFEKAARLEPGSKWAEDARRRANAIAQPVTPWRPAIEAKLAATTDPRARRALILANLESARRFAEGPYVLEWSVAVLEGRNEDARNILRVIRLIGEVVAEALNDRMVTDAVKTIDLAERRGSSARLELARAQKMYADGRLAFSVKNNPQAIALLSQASKDLASLKSPLQYISRYYTAGVLYEETRADEALQIIESLDRDQIEAKGYLSLDSLLEWERGISYLVRGAYSEAFRAFNQGYTRNMTYGNREQAAAFDALAAEALEYLGDSREAWSRRARALAALSNFQSGLSMGRRSVTLLSAVNLQIAARNFERANALLEYAVPLAQVVGDKSGVPIAFAQRAVTRAELRDLSGAASDRAQAARALALVDPDSRLRTRLKVDLDIASGVAKRLSSPQDAVAYFTSAIDVLRRSGQSALLPRLYFERARAYEDAGDVAHAREDLRAVLEVVAEWEEATVDLEQRAAIGIWSDASRRDLISLELRQKDVGAAFNYADARRTAAPAVARVPVTSRQSSHIEMQRALAPNAAILEYVTTRDVMIAFIIRRTDVRAVRLPARVARIAAVAEAMRNAEDEDLPATAAALYDLILRDIRHRLAGVTTLAVIPDRELTGISFSALYDRKSNRFLIEEVAVVHDPTANAAMEWSRQAKPPREGTMLSIGASAFDRKRYTEPDALPSVDGEADKVADFSPGAHRLLGTNATPDAVQRELSSAAVVHYAGHIVDRGPDARLLLAPARGRDSLTAREIAALRLDRTRVVVLAACRGSGTTERHAIVQDMATAFLTAGVPTVVASATDVDDNEAPETMRRLHALLAADADAAEALRTVAQRDRREGKPVPLSVRLLVMGGSRSLVR